MKKQHIILVVVFSLIVIPCVSAETTPPSIKVYKDNVTYPVADNWTCIEFNSVDNDTLFENCATLLENGNLRINKSGLYTVGGAVYLDLAVTEDRSNVTFLMRVKRNDNHYLRDTQKELTENIFKSRHEESVSFTGVEKLEKGDNICLEYWTNEPDLMFISDKKFSENIAASLYITALTDDDPPKILNDSKNYCGQLGVVFGMGSFVMLIVFVVSKRNKGGANE